MQFKKQTRDVSIFVAILMFLGFAVIQRFDREVVEMQEAGHHMETFHAR